MNRLFLITLISTLSLAFSEGESEKRKGGTVKGKKRDKKHMARFFEKLDTDQDGKVTRTEFDQAPRIQGLEEDIRGRLFVRLDKNSDGMISSDEIKPGKRDFLVPDSGRFLHQADANQDHQISWEEFEAYPRFAKLEERYRKQLFDRLDRNNNEMIDPEDGPKPRINFAQLDADENGMISFEEFLMMPHIRSLDKGAQKKSFERLDRDSDGSISAEELKLKQVRHRYDDRKGRAERGNGEERGDSRQDFRESKRREG